VGRPGPAGEPGSRPIDPERAAERLTELLQRSGLDEVREAQDTFAARRPSPSNRASARASRG
jgi:hypothetical protein